MKPGLFQILIIAMIILVLFGRGRISEMMGDFGKGVSSFKKGLAETEDMAKPAAQIPPPPAPPPVSAPAEAVRTPEEEAAARRDPGG